MRKVFETHGTCSQAIIIDIDDTTQVVNEVQFLGGCQGNTSGIASLVKGMPAADVIARLKGITCGMKATSCPDQLAQALQECLA